MRGAIFQFTLRRTFSTLPEHGGLTVWNNIKKNSNPLRSKVPNLLTWYACGPTVYDSAHIGHARY